MILMTRRTCPGCGSPFTPDDEHDEYCFYCDCRRVLQGRQGSPGPDEKKGPRRGLIGTLVDALGDRGNDASS